MVPRDNDKPAVLALREIAAGYDVTREGQEQETEEVDVDRNVLAETAK